MAQLIPLPLAVKSRFVLPFWYRLTWVVPEKGLLNICVCVTCLFVQHVVNMGVDATDMNHQTVSDVSPSVTHHVTHDDVNISEEVSKTGIWHHLNSQPTLAPAPSAAADVSQPRHRSAVSPVPAYYYY